MLLRYFPYLNGLAIVLFGSLGYGYFFAFFFMVFRDVSHVLGGSLYTRLPLLSNLLRHDDDLDGLLDTFCML